MGNSLNNISNKIVLLLFTNRAGQYDGFEYSDPDWLPGSPCAGRLFSSSPVFSSFPFCFPPSEACPRPQPPPAPMIQNIHSKI